MTASVRDDGPDLSARQMAILLNIYLTQQPHTVRGLALALNLGKPAVTRALDTLSRLGYVKRRKDPEDLRNVLVQRTVRGSVFLSEFADRVVSAAEEAAEEAEDDAARDAA
ncbi:MAG: MarR family transcriptional regulator [Pseudomonadota bacterium]